ncbi:SRPBCC family protein [Pontivivens insulae]|nr:SRPBCC family protein [Pontivivens insulae]
MALASTLTVGSALVALLAAAPFALPRAQVIERTAVVAADPSIVFDLIESSAGYQRFNPYRDTDAELQITPFGPEAGVGSGFAFEGREGTGTQTVTAVTPDREIVHLIDLGAMGQPVQTFTLTPVAGGTEVRWAIRSEFGLNPIGRVFGLFMDGMLGPRQEAGLENLSATLTPQA